MGGSRRILFLDGTRGFHPTRMDSGQPCGGIVTSLTIIPRILASSYGFDVTVATASEYHGTLGGVKYITAYDLHECDYDQVVFNRNLINHHLVESCRNARRILWFHDIVDYKYFEDDACNDVDVYVSLSDYCTESHADFYGLDRSKFVKIGNGIDPLLFHAGRYEHRDPHLFVYASAPIKGMYPLEFTLYQLKRHDAAARLEMYCDMALHDEHNSAATEITLAALKDTGAVVYQPIGQSALADVFRHAYALLMPNHYPEICSNLLLQAQACGLPVVASDIGSASEYITHRETGMLTSRKPDDMFWWWKDYALQTVMLQKDKGLHRHISERCVEVPQTWEQVAAQWAKLLEV